MSAASHARWALVFLGRGESSEADEPLTMEGGRPLARGEALSLAWKQSPRWNPKLGHERVIVGSHPERADLQLRGAGVRPEHLRIYISLADGSVEARPLDEGTTRVDGRDLARLEIVELRGGEEIALGPWTFRFESREHAGLDSRGARA